MRLQAVLIARFVLYSCAQCGRYDLTKLNSRNGISLTDSKSYLKQVRVNEFVRPWENEKAGALHSKRRHVPKQLPEDFVASAKKTKEVMVLFTSFIFLIFNKLSIREYQHVLFRSVYNRTQYGITAAS